MLKPEIAKKQLEQWQVLSQDDIDSDGRITRFAGPMGKLPAKLAKIGLGLFGLTEKGAPFPKNDENLSDRRRTQATGEFDQLSAKDRTRILGVVFPKMADDVNRAWEMLRSAPYTGGWAKRAFRAPHDHAASLSGRWTWLDSMLNIAERYREDQLSPAWLAAWAPFIQGRYYGTFEEEIGRLLAAVIDAGGKSADDVFQIICDSARNEHEVGAMGRHVTQSLLLSSRPDGWELIEKMLLAAQRQEGLRQTILEAIDLAHPEAYRRILRLIRSENLARFSAVVRAVNVWFGFAWDGVSVKVVNDAIDLALTMLEDPRARAKALNGDQPNPAYFSLWATAFHDAHAAIPLAKKLMSHKQPEMRFVACILLGHLQLDKADAVRDACLKDEDLRVAHCALDGSGRNPFADRSETSDSTREQAERFAMLERLYERVPEKQKTFEPIVWPWTGFKLGREDIASYLLSSLGSLPPTRLLPYASSFGTWDRRGLIELFKEQKKWDPHSREVVIGMAGDASADVRSAAFEAIDKLKLTEPELVRLESMLTRKAVDLRRNVLALTLKLSDDQSLSSADRLLAAKDANQRQAGLELIRQLFEQKRSAEACRERLAAYRSSRPKLTKDEQTQISAVLDVSPEAQAVTLTNALGLMDPSKRTPVIAPVNRNATIFTDAEQRTLKSLDDLVHAHREEPIVTDRKTGKTELLGAIQWAFPSCNTSRPPEKEVSKLPLREVWEGWWKSRPKSDRDPDGLELWRAYHYFQFTDSYRYDDEVKRWASQKGRTAFVELLRLKSKPAKLKYERVVMEVLEWLMFLHPSDNEFDHLLNICETLYAMVPEEDLKTPFQKLGGDGKKNVYRFMGSEETELDWRDIELFAHWTNKAESEIEKRSDAQFIRLWNLLHWADQPRPGVPPHRPSLEVLFKAYGMGLANLHEIANELAGPRNKTSYGMEGFGTLSTLTARKLAPHYDRFLREHPEVSELVDRCRSIILDVELQRGETPTVVSDAAGGISSLEGIDTLVRILSVLGKTGFKKSRYYSGDAKSRAESLTNLVSITNPANDDTHEQFVSLVKAALKAGAFPEDRLLELAFLAPQWVKFIEAFFQWNGFAEALYWFLAHMHSWGSDAEERAAQGAGLEDDPDENSCDVTDEEDDDDTDSSDQSAADSAPKIENPPKLSAWQRLILERTTLTDQERQDGAIDVAWFRRVHAELGLARWKKLAQAARFAANANQARKAQLLADVLLGETKVDDLIHGIKTKYLKEYVRLLGLFPLPSGANRQKELKRRFDVMQEYGRYARQLSGLTKPEALRSLQIGLRNLAGTAGFPDPMRLEWALGADSLKDLARGPVIAKKDGVTVTLILDERTQPQLSVARGDKPLKTTPPAVKKDKTVAALFERAKDLKRQVSRQRQSLEAMMCRGDSISAGELVALCQHALVAPLLKRLIFIGDGILGYPDKKGAALRNFDGNFVSINKSQQLRIAHPFDLFQLKQWDKWQHECFGAERMQPFKQIFRELYVVTKQERQDGDQSKRYAGQQVNPTQAYALWGQRGWNTDDGVFKTFHDENIIASVSFNYGFMTPLEVEGLTIGSIHFAKRGEYKLLPLAKVPPRLFSEVMRDLDLVVSVAHAGGVDPEATASTVEMRTNLMRETCQLLSLKNVRFKASHAVIDGQLGQYTVHLGSGTVHRMPGGSVCMIPVHSQHRGRLFLPFADDDPRTVEVMSKVLMLARDQEIQDPSILEQLRA